MNSAFLALSEILLALSEILLTLSQNFEISINPSIECLDFAKLRRCVSSAK